MKYRPEVDGLRAVAVIPVMLFHAGFEAFSGGFVGVDIFFVISGYLITSIIVEEMRRGEFTIAKFYERRARRILPALFAVCIVCIPFAWSWMSPPEFKDFSQSLVAVVVFASNVLFWLETGYFERAVELKPLLHTWSLAVEEQFYLLYPLLLLLVHRFWSRATVGVIAVTAVTSFGIAIYAAGTHPSANFYLIPTRAWELGVGALVALAAKDSRVRGALADAGTACGMALICIAVFGFTENTPSPSQYTVVPVVGTALMLLFVGHDRFFGVVLRSQVAVFIGLISYSLYLWHLPILAFVRLRFDDQMSVPTAFACLSLTAALSVLTWRYIEVPFRDRKRVSMKSVSAIAGAVALLLVNLGFAGHVSQGFERATAKRAAASALEARLLVDHGLGSTCEDRFTVAADCRTSENPDVVVWGDSFATHLVSGLIASAPEAHLIQFTKSLCGPVLDVAPINREYPLEWAKGCLEFNRQVWEWLERSRSAKYVVLSSPFDQYLDIDGMLYTKDGVRKADLEFTAQSFDSTLDRLEALGLQPVVVSPPPNVGRDIGRCLYRSGYLGVDLSRCSFARKDYLVRHERVLQLLRQIAKNHRVIWLDEVLCDSMTCYASVGSVFIYGDFGHLSHEGSVYLGRKMRLYEQVTKGLTR